MAHSIECITFLTRKHSYSACLSFAFRATRSAFDNLRPSGTGYIVVYLASASAFASVSLRIYCNHAQDLSLWYADPKKMAHSDRKMLQPMHKLFQRGAQVKNSRRIKFKLIAGHL